MFQVRKRKLALVFGLLFLFGSTGMAAAAVGVGDTAPLFKSIDENKNPVDLANLINGKPLVIAVGSAS